MTYVPVDVIIDNRAKQRHRIDTLNLLAYVSLLVLVLVTTWFLKRRRKLCVHETGLAIIYGLILGAGLRYCGLEVTITSVTLEDKTLITVPADYILVKARNLADKTANVTHTYAYEFRGELSKSARLGSQISYASVDPEVFFNIILPPIVLNAGLSLKRRHFFRNIGAIFTYAFLGTTLSVAFVGGFLYTALQLLKTVAHSPYLADQFPLTSCLYFGAIISPTDPLAVLAIFQELGVDLNLFALVFGESILNDAVAIVLTSAIDQFSVTASRNPYYSPTALILDACLKFINMLASSALTGIVFGVVSALVTKFTKLTESPLLETSLVVLMSYASFLVAEVADASGIVAILLCGITQAHYTINNLSFEARERIRNLFELLTFLCENFLFLAVGVCFWQRGQTWDLSFIGLAFAAVTLARAISIYPLTAILNLGRRNKIPCNFQHIIAWGGAARGVISYSLASRNTVGDARRIMLSTTSVIVITSVVAVGSFVGPLLRWLRIPFSDEDTESKVPAYSGNNPSWLVRPKRLNRPNSEASSCYTQQTPGKAPRSRQHVHSVDVTPVLEVETLACQHFSRGNRSIADSECSVTHLMPNQDDDRTSQASFNNNHQLQPEQLPALPEASTTTERAEDALGNSDPLARLAPDERPYENASLVRRWRNLDNNFIKPLLTNSQPTLVETMPPVVRSLARIFTSDEQLMRLARN